MSWRISETPLSAQSSESVQLPARRLDAPACQLGESPRWDGEYWWWVDAAAGKIWRGRVDGAGEILAGEFWTPGGRVSVVHPAAHGGVVAVTRDSLVGLDRSGTENWRIPLPMRHDELLNDGIAAPDGSLWVGTVAQDQSATGALLHVSVKGEVQRFDTGTQLSNGMVWADEDTLLHADSRERTVLSRNIAGDRALSDADSAFSLGELPPGVMPDGLARDVDGGVWIALYGAGEVRRYANGAVTHAVRIPAAQSTAVALGGHDGKALLITSAQEGFSELQARTDPHAGRLFLARVDVPGLPADNALITPLDFGAQSVDDTHVVPHNE